ncbi:MAG: PilN domain-containing protein [Pseudomonadales bacterium]|nr:PilN domain-containing protein [Pseudomonadales bacterium]
MNSENKRLESDIDERHNALELVKIDPKLESTLKQLKLKNADKRRVTSYINNMGLDSEHSVTQFYEALSENVMPGLWLSEIVLYNQASDIVLKGLARNASDVPIYIERMKSKPLFESISFHSMHLRKVDKFPLYTEFNLDSRKQKDEG